jgi:phosphocarrier protein HPr
VVFPAAISYSRFPFRSVFAMAETSAERNVVVVNTQGFHARPAHLFVKMAMSFQSKVQIRKGNQTIDGKSILDLLTLGAGNGTELTLRAAGADADAAVEALAQLVESGFGEMNENGHEPAST